MPKQKTRFSARTNALIAALALLIVLAGAYFTGQFDDLLGRQMSGDALEVHVIDVGNADSIFVTQGGKNLLIDAGTKAAEGTVLSYLHARGVRRLDVVIATHADADHIGGMAKVLSTFEVGTFVMAFMPEGYTPTSATYERMLEAIDAKPEILLREASPGETLPLGEAAVEILGPIGDFESNNNQSVVCRVTYGETRFLFMGDAEKEAENALLERWADLHADFLKVGHHGSNTSSQQTLLDAVRPTYAAITCGAGNSYGHPKPEVIQRLEKMNIQILRSDLDGDIVLKSDGRRLTARVSKSRS